MAKWGQGLVFVVSLAVVAGTNAFGQDPEPLLLGDSAADLVYTPVTPCRIIDTRLAGGTLTAGVPRSFLVSGTIGFEAQGGNPGGCAVPEGATAVMVNLVAVGAEGPGNLRAWAFGQPVPLAAVINYAAVPGLNLANGVAVPICNPWVTTCAFDLTVRADVSATQLVADILGYFVTTGPVGDITAVTPGAGLTGGGTSGDVTLGVDSSAIQLRVGGSCPPGSSIRVINEDGTVLCQINANSGGTVTSITAGAGLQGGTITTSGTISVDFAGTGSANTVARSDHTHTPPVVTRTKTINALTCIAQGGAFSGDTLTCASGSMVRTDGDGLFPCVVPARTVRDTWLCDLDLPPGSQITNITANAIDSANDGYMEALVWRTGPTQTGPNLFSNFGGNWQSSGTAFAGGATSFPIFSAASPHTVSGDFRYVIGFGMKSPTSQNLWALSFHVTYTVQ